LDEKIAGIFAEVIGKDRAEVNLSALLKSVKGWDSLKHMEVVVRMEEGFSITFTGDEIASFTTLNDVIKIMEKKKNA
jgi:acyl carrier protein